MIILDCEQCSDEWFAARVGVPSASCFDKIITTTGKPSAQREKYLYQLAGERLLGCKEESYQSAAMTRGIELEPEAREAYEFITGTEVETVGIVYKDERKRFSCSPDGLPPERGLEIKCPSLSVHTEYLHKGKLPTTYFQQVQGSLYITGLEAWDFTSYYPGMDQLIVTVEPDFKWHKILEAELERFCDDLDKVTEALKRGKFH